MSDPSGRPLSHFILERYVLGELTADEAAQVRRRLQVDPRSEARLATIQNASSPPAWVTVVAEKRSRRRPWGLGLPRAALGLAAAAALALTFELASRERYGSVTTTGLKGAALALTLVGEYGGVAPDRFRRHERFKALVTCAPSETELYQLSVEQAGQLYTPLEPLPSVKCGNQVTWPGAFSLEGNSVVRVCVTAESTGTGLEPVQTCVTLMPAGRP